jgi:S-DNA-T family DNA segregation ATPase FtsK/SpoIIIE
MILAFLLLASLLNSHRESGPALQFAATLLLSTFGVGAWAVPLLCLACAVFIGMDRAPRIPRGQISGAALVYLVFLSLVHLAALSGRWPVDARQVTQAGGYVGASIAYAFTRVLGEVGAYILLVGMALASVLMVARTSWSEFLGGLGEAVIGLFRGIGRGFSRITPHLHEQGERPVAPAKQKSRKERAVVERRPDPSTAPFGAVGSPSVMFNEDEQLGDAPVDLTAPKTEVRRKSPLDDAYAVASARPLDPDVDPDVDPGPVVEPAVTPHAPEVVPETRQFPGMRTRAPRKPQSEPEPSKWSLPRPDLLTAYPDDVPKAEDRAAIENMIRILQETLTNFGVPNRVRDYQHGPTITRFEVELDPGIRVSKVTQLQGDIAMALAVGKVRIEAPIPGKRAVGIEVPNSVRRIVSLRSCTGSDEFEASSSPLAIALGKDVAGKPVVVDLEAMPHLLVAGQTGSGKSVCLHTIIVSLLMRTTPDELRLVLVDPKRVEMTRYDGIPHLYAPVVSSVRETADVLRKTIREMQRRLDKFAVSGVSNITEYNAEIVGVEDLAGETPPHMPLIVVIIDELADLMMQARAEVEQSLCRLAQLARAAGIHVVVATQRPSVNVITGHIKANFPARVAMRLPASHDSRTILDSVGADRLLGHGDMLLMNSELSKPQRVQGAYVERADVERVSDFLRDQGEPDFRILPEVSEEEGGGEFGEAEVGDELFDAAVRYVVSEQEASVSMLQRRFKVGYARAGRLVDLMERRGIVGPHEGSRPRRVMVGAHNVTTVLQNVLGARHGMETDALKPTPDPDPATPVSS